MLVSLWISLAVVCLAVFYVSTKVPKPVPKGLRTVPGPKGIPLAGNMLQLGLYPQQKLTEWTQQYGEIYQIKLGYYNWVFLGSPTSVKEILDKQSAVTSGRVPMSVCSDLISGGMRFLLMSHTPTWRKLRAIVHKLLTPKSSATFMPSQEFEAKQLVYDLLSANDGDEKWYQHIRRYTTSVVMTSTYGRRIPTWDCEDVREIYGLMKDFSEATAFGAFFADAYPPLANIPTWMQLWRKRALQSQERQRRIWLRYFQQLRVQMDTGNAPECFVKGMIQENFQKEGISEVQGAFVAGTMIEAGSETTSSALNSLMKYLVAYPDSQRRAHEELDRVIGRDRLPIFADEESLPYMRAIGKEVLRLRPATNMGIPHFTTASVTYKDFFIPAGTVVAVQQYGISLDPVRYPDPHAFKPERYLGHPLKAGAYTGGDPNKRDHFAFGAGRRICPGMHLSEASLFIALARILWAFEIKAGVGADGKEQVVDTSDEAYEIGATVVPKSCRLRFVARSEKTKEIVLQEWAQAKVEGYYLGEVKVDESGILAS